MILGVPIAGDSVFGAAGGPIKTVQSLLANMGLPVRPTGVLDDATVSAVNGVLGDWDDAPPKLRTGRLTKHEVAANLPTITHLVKRAAGGATNFERLPE